MTLKIDSQEDEQRQLAVTIEVSEMRVNKEMKAIVRKYGKDANVPGFRKGKAPYHVVVKLIGAEQLRYEAISEMFETVFDEAMKELNVVPYGQVNAEDISFEEPVTFKLNVPLEPIVQLGDYRAMRKSFELIDVKDEAVEEQVQLFLKSHAETVEVDRPAALGDIVTVTGKGYLGDDEEDVIFNEDGEGGYDFMVEVDNPTYPGVSIEEQLVGATAGSTLTFTLTFPEDDDTVPSDLSGETATFTLNVLTVKAATLPELTDDLVQKHFKGLESVEAMREDIRKQLETAAQNQFKQDVFQSGLEEMTDNVEQMLYPPAVVAKEISRMVEDIKGRVTRSGMDWEVWLTSNDRTEEELQDDYEDAAVDQIERSLVMQEFVRLEKLKVSSEEFNAEIDKRIGEYDDNPKMQQMMRQFWTQSGGEMIAQELIYNKVYNRLLAIYAGEAPDLSNKDSDEDESEPQSVEETETAVAKG